MLFSWANVCSSAIVVGREAAVIYVYAIPDQSVRRGQQMSTPAAPINTGIVVT